MTEKLLSLKDISKVFTKSGARIVVLKDVFLDIAYNESIAIVGASGSGKSTFLQLLGLLDRPTKGQLFLNGKDVGLLSGGQVDKMRNQFLGFIFQFHHLLPDHNALFNVMMPLLVRGISQAEARKSASELLERVGLGERMKHLPGELSGGEQQRVAVARCLVGKPKLILADEPTGNLDPQTSKDIMNLLRSLTEEIGGSLVVVTHNMELARTCSRVLRLRDGTFERDV